MERIPADNWIIHAGHVRRYELARDLCAQGDAVLDAACGVGYGAAVLPSGIRYTGVDRPGVADRKFAQLGQFIEADLMTWQPSRRYDLGISFETLEHVTDPQRLADVLHNHCNRLIVSTPTVPTKHMNPHHLHDFDLDGLIGLFPHRTPTRIVEQPEELAHIVVFA